MDKTSVQFFFDYISPYAYLAWTQLRSTSGEPRYRLKPVPVLFAGLLNAHGQLGPAEIPAKRDYVIKNVLRLARGFDVPLNIPPAHPFNPLLPLRVTLAAGSEGRQLAIIDALYRAVWGRGEAIDSERAIASALAAADIDAAPLINRASRPDVKAHLRSRTENAVAAGVFGVPSLLVNGELFWGCDALPQFHHYLAHGDGLDQEQIARWRKLPSSARRPVNQPAE